jgi:putative flavoprotein involved in K+ transport
LDVDIRTGTRVTEVHAADNGFQARLADDTTLTARSVTAATGSFGRPHRPKLGNYTGTVVHSADYRSPQPFAGQRVIVVGAGNSAVQIAVELAEHAEVTLATRKPVRYASQRPLGRDLHFWLAVTGLDSLPIGHLLRRHPTVPVLDDGTYRRAVNAARPDLRPLFTSAEGTEITWPDGRREHVNTILLATGYRPDLDYLRPLKALDDHGFPLHTKGISTVQQGLGYVGLEWQRSLASATLRGVARDAHYVLARMDATSRR